MARLAGVSVTTVSRHLNGHLRLPEATEARILRALDQLHYRPNPHARRLSTGRSDTIGFVVPDIANPFFARMAAAAESEADARGLQLALFPTDNRPGRERAYVEALAGGHVDGLIFATNHAEHGDLAEAIGAAGRIVLVDEDVCGASAPRVFCDNYAGGRLAGGHLAGLGHRRVAYFGAGLAMLTGRRRYEGLRDGLADVAGAVEPPGLYPCAYSRAGGSAAARAFLADGRPATAILAAADEVAIGALEVLRAAGLRVPRDLSLVGFDDVAPLHLFDPPLTAIRQPIEAIGRRAVRLLTDPEFDSGAAPEEILAVDLMVRASCAPCPA